MAFKRSLVLIGLLKKAKDIIAKIRKISVNSLKNSLSLGIFTKLDTDVTENAPAKKINKTGADNLIVLNPDFIYALKCRPALANRLAASTRLTLRGKTTTHIL